MTRYIAIADPKARYDGYDVLSKTGNSTADVAVVEDHIPTRTGLLDAHGVPLYRLPESIPLGFDITGGWRK
jgi:hypothetical protein